MTTIDLELDGERLVLRSSGRAVTVALEPAADIDDTKRALGHALIMLMAPPEPSQPAPSKALVKPRSRRGTRLAPRKQTGRSKARAPDGRKKNPLQIFATELTRGGPVHRAEGETVEEFAERAQSEGINRSVNGIFAVLRALSDASA